MMRFCIIKFRICPFLKYLVVWHLLPLLLYIERNQTLGARKCVLLCFHNGIKGYLLLYLHTRETFLHRNVTFYEKSLPFKSVSPTAHNLIHPSFYLLLKPLMISSHHPFHPNTTNITGIPASTAPNSHTTYASLVPLNTTQPANNHLSPLHTIDLPSIPLNTAQSNPAQIVPEPAQPVVFQPNLPLRRSS